MNIRLIAMRKKLKIAILLLLFFCALKVSVLADESLDQYRNRNIESANNYIFLLVHGTGGSAKDMGEIYNFMTKSIPNSGLGLTKVYKYSFKDKFGSIRDWAKEIDQFMASAKTEAGTTEANFVLICHSAGGLAARYYVNNSGLYQGNIKKIVTINTPHLGSPSGKASIWAEINRPYRYYIPLTLMLMAYDPSNAFNKTKLAAVIKNFASYYWASTATTDFLETIIDRGDYQLVREQIPGSNILNEINS